MTQVISFSLTSWFR